MFICKNCGKEFDKDWRKRNYKEIPTTCCEKCAKSFAGKTSFRGKQHSEEVKKKIGKTLNVGGKIPESIFDVSTRTQRKILQRMNIGCSKCGWKESSCDIHHIIEKKNGGLNNHNNLTYICPNCHRMVHNNLIKVSELKSFDLYLKELGKDWKEYFYG